MTNNFSPTEIDIFCRI